MQVIVISKWDRWCRDVYVGQKMLRDVEPYRVRVVCLTADLDAATPEGGLMVVQMQGFAEYDKKNIVRRCALGRHGMAARGYWPGTVPRYGYRREGSSGRGHSPRTSTSTAPGRATFCAARGR